MHTLSRPRRNLAITLCLALVAGLTALGGCGPAGLSPGDLEAVGADGSETLGTGGKADNPSDPNAPALPDITGAYALELDSTVTSRDLRTGAIKTYQPRLAALVQVKQDGAEVSLTVKLCDAVLPEVASYEPTMAPDLVPSLAAVTVSGTLEQEEGVVRLVTEPGAFVIAARLENPVVDPLPTSSSDPRVVDEDRDGRPGVTISAMGFSVYGAVRAIFVLDGFVEEDGAIGGPADLEESYAIYGDTVPFVDVAARVEEKERTHEVTHEDAFRLVPLDDDEPTCATVADVGLFD